MPRIVSCRIVMWRQIFWGVTGACCLQIVRSLPQQQQPHFMQCSRCAKSACFVSYDLTMQFAVAHLLKSVVRRARI